MTDHLRDLVSGWSPGQATDATEHDHEEASRMDTLVALDLREGPGADTPAPAAEASGEMSVEEFSRVLRDDPWGRAQRLILAHDAALRARLAEAEERARWAEDRVGVLEREESLLVGQLQTSLAAAIARAEEAGGAAFYAFVAGAMKRTGDRRTVERRAPKPGVTVRVRDEPGDVPRRIRRARYDAMPPTDPLASARDEAIAAARQVSALLEMMRDDDLARPASGNSYGLTPSGGRLLKIHHDALIAALDKMEGK